MTSHKFGEAVEAPQDNTVPKARKEKKKCFTLRESNRIYTSQRTLNIAV